jgi:hypothetical protein
MFFRVVTVPLGTGRAYNRLRDNTVCYLEILMILEKPVLITRTQARTMLSCSRALLRGLERRGELRPLRLGEGGKGLRYKLSEVEALIARHYEESNATP